MAEENKIISFDSLQKKRQKDQYNLTAEISVHICRDNETYYIDWHSTDANITQEEIYNILESIFQRLSDDIPYIMIKEEDYYEITFTLFYYENPFTDDFKYICVPQDISDEKLTEYLFTSLSIYNLKKSSSL